MKNHYRLLANFSTGPALTHDYSHMNDDLAIDYAKRCIKHYTENGQVRAHSWYVFNVDTTLCIVHLHTQVEIEEIPID